MKAQQAAKAIKNANIDLTIRKPSDYKPRKGYKLVHEKYIRGVAPTADSTHRILGRGYFWTEKGTKELCYVIEIPTAEATPLNRMFENEKAEYRRKHRCKIWNKKRTKKIMCPFANSCSKCTLPPDEKFPSEAEEHQELSYEEVNKDKLYDESTGYGSETHMNWSIEMKEMMDKLKSLEDKTLYTLGTLLNLQYEVEEIQKRLNLDDESMKEYSVEYIMYYHKYIG